MFARSHHRRLRFGHRASGPLTALQVAKLYNFPTGLDGTGQTIALVELGGGFTQPDLSAYFGGLGLAVPSVTAVAVDGAGNSPGSDADGEVLLDIMVAGAVAPKARIIVVFAPNTDQGFADAVAYAIAHADVVSISWGAPEDAWPASSLAAMESAFAQAAVKGVSVFAAAGDNGSSDGESGIHADYPASSPSVTGCGGTALTPTTETVWNDGTQGGATGGGFSTAFARPAYQSSIKQGSGRGVPDISGDADPNTGYIIVIDGQTQVIGGTSAVAPLWAGLTALLNQGVGRNLGPLNPLLYALPAGVLRDIAQGNNGAYKAVVGWDACTGLGSPDGTKLLAALKGGTGTSPPPPTPTAGAVRATVSYDPTAKTWSIAAA